MNKFIFVFVIFIFATTVNCDDYSCVPNCLHDQGCCRSQCYNKQSQLCCNGVIRTKVGTRPQCCGSNVLDYAKQTCCNGQPQDRNGITWCCNTAGFSPFAQECCNGVVVPVGNCNYNSFSKMLMTSGCGPCGPSQKCCGATCYDPSIQTCCSGTVTIKSQGNQNQVCCGSNLVDATKSMCCNGNPQPLSTGISYCCTTQGYDPTVQMCCLNTVKTIGYCNENLMTTNCKATCGSFCYDPDKMICCEEHVNVKQGNNSVCCGVTSMDQSISVCCDSRVQPKFANGTTNCFRAVSYNANIQKVCDYDGIVDIYAQCSSCQIIIASIATLFSAVLSLVINY